MPGYGARSLTVPASQSIAGSNLVGGPVRLKGWSLIDGTADVDLFVRNSANAPGAGATIASLALPAGDCLIEWELELTGTPGVGDIDNVQLSIGPTAIARSVNLGAVGNYPQNNAECGVPSGGLTLTATAIGAATAGSVYAVNITAIPQGQSQAKILDGGQPVGFPSMGEGRADTIWLGEEGVAIRTGLSVLSTQGVVTGVLWYEEVYGADKPETRSQSEG